MARTRLKWIIESDGVDMREVRPTRKSADRLAQRYADTFNEIFWYYTNREKAKSKRAGKTSVKMYEVRPNNG